MKVILILIAICTVILYIISYIEVNTICNYCGYKNCPGGNECHEIKRQKPLSTQPKE